MDKRTLEAVRYLGYGKHAVDGLRFSRNTGYGRGAGTKRSRWAGSVAGGIAGSRPRTPGSEQGTRLTTDFQPIAQYVGS